MPPKQATISKHVIEIKVARIQLRNCSMSTIRDTLALRNPNPRSVKSRLLLTDLPRPSLAAQAISEVRNASREQRSNQPANRVAVNQRGQRSSAQAEDPRETTGDVVLTTACPSGKKGGLHDPRLPRIQTKHYLAERHHAAVAFALGAKRNKLTHIGTLSRSEKRP